MLNYNRVLTQSLSHIYRFNRRKKNRFGRKYQIKLGSAETVELVFYNSATQMYFLDKLPTCPHVL